jgi:hypothetical protein
MILLDEDDNGAVPPRRRTFDSDGNDEDAHRDFSWLENYRSFAFTYLLRIIAKKKGEGKENERKRREEERGEERETNHTYHTIGISLH